MRTFLGMLVVLTVSGDGGSIRGDLEGSVLLSCNCSERDVDKEFKWQVESKQMDKPVLKYNNGSLNVSGRYKGRTKIFEEASNNCSLQLNNISLDDSGEYKCIFHRKGIYQRLVWNLSISASYRVCQKNKSSSVFQCEVHGRYAKAEIQWRLDGQLLTNQSTVQINNSSVLDATTGLYLFKSELILQLNRTSIPECSINANGISTTMDYECGVLTGSIKASHNRDCSMKYLKIIPVVLMLGLFLVLCRRWKNSQGMQRTREVKTINERPEGEAMISKNC